MQRFLYVTVRLSMLKVRNSTSQKQVQVHLFTQITLSMVQEVHKETIHLNRYKVRGIGTQYTYAIKKKEYLYTKYMCYCVKKARAD